MKEPAATATFSDRKAPHEIGQAFAAFLIDERREVHRTWDTKTNTWGEWHPNGSLLFPGGISFEWKNGAWVARESTQLKYFVPGPGESVIQPQRPAKDTGLPPGMSRGK